MRKLGVILVVLAASASLSCCGYNELQRQDESVKAAWSEVVNNYQRRSDLIPNLVATVKGSLVACYFMHLISEKKLILWVLALTVAFFIVLMLVPYWTVVDKIGG